MKKIIISSNGLILFNRPEDLSSFLQGALKMVPFPGKGEKMIELGVQSFEVLDHICTMMVPPKELSKEVKRRAVNSFLDSKVNNQISKKTNAHFDQKIEELSNILRELDAIEENHNEILKGVSRISDSTTASSLRNEILSKGSVQISSFEAVLHKLIDQSSNDQKNIQKIKDSIDEIVASKIIKDKSSLKALEAIAIGLAMSLKSFLRVSSQADDFKKLITEYCKLQKEYQLICMQSVA